MQTRSPIILNTDETKDTSPVTLRPSWVSDRGPVGSATTNPKASTTNRKTDVLIPAAVEPVVEPVVEVTANEDGGGTANEVIEPIKAPLPAIAPE